MNFFPRHFQDLRKQGTHAATNSESDGENQKFQLDNLLSRLAMAARVNFIFIKILAKKCILRPLGSLHLPQA
jgi:hypothetical protein